MPAPYTVATGADPGRILFTVDDDGNVVILGTLTLGGSLIGPALPTTLQGLVPPYALEIADPNTMIISRTVYAPAGTDMWRFTVAGVRGAYANEGGQWRMRDPIGNQVASRSQCNVADNGTNQHISEATLSDNTVQWFTTAAGDSASTRDITVGRNLIVTTGATVAGSAVTTAAGWSSFADMASLGANVTLGTPHLQSRTEPGTVTRLQGQLVLSGTVAGGGTLFTVPAGQIPGAGDAIYSLRFSGTGAAAFLLTISGSTGIATSSANMVVGNTFNLDGITYVHV